MKKKSKQAGVLEERAEIFLGTTKRTLVRHLVEDSVGLCFSVPCKELSLCIYIVSPPPSFSLFHLSFPFFFFSLLFFRREYMILL